ncbi:transposase [Alkalicoccobacillus porphyridii]|uniref:Transposase n=1 Tax=Alkalicoccobacillus porphyridii TaxID=2597270 RepID=A0A554A0D9_9BACI|nr:transposase [Alkalicoccobacillus porphyridii]TSB47106.1 transposase [Alkalicoccobacillus porphyridii]
MTIMVFIIQLLISIIMVVTRRKWEVLSFIYDGLALASFLVFSSIAAASVFEIIVNHTVFMTNIHALFLNGVVLLSASYLILFIPYKLLLSLLD